MDSTAPIPRACADRLNKLTDHVSGEQVLYATRFMRPEGKLKGASTVAVARFAVDAALKAASRAIASGIPGEGWLIATPTGIWIFKKSLTGGVGSHLGTLTAEAIAGVSVAHGKKATKTQITITMVDQSFATLWVKTAETYPALSPWIRGQAVTAPTGLDAALPPVPNAPLFDPDELLNSLPGHGS